MSFFQNIPYGFSMKINVTNIQLYYTYYQQLVFYAITIQTSDHSKQDIRDLSPNMTQALP